MLNFASFNTRFDGCAKCRVYRSQEIRTNKESASGFCGGHGLLPAAADQRHDG